MMLPRLTVTPKTCLLRVIDNDTGVEVPQLFHKVIPHHYKPNKVMNYFRLCMCIKMVTV